jgi:hypothetical protein
MCANFLQETNIFATGHNGLYQLFIVRLHSAPYIHILTNFISIISAFITMVLHNTKSIAILVL